MNSTNRHKLLQKKLYFVKPKLQCPTTTTIQNYFLLNYNTLYTNPIEPQERNLTP
jgi:hypothetical protein